MRLISNLTGWPDKMSKRGKDWIQKESWHVDLFKSEKVETKSQSVPFQQISKTSGLKFSFMGETNAAGVNRISFLFSVLLTTLLQDRLQTLITFTQSCNPQKLIHSSYPASR